MSEFFPSSFFEESEGLSDVGNETQELEHSHHTDQSDAVSINLKW